MTPIADWIKIDAAQVARSLQEAAAKLPLAEGELVLDFSAVLRVDAPAVELLKNMSKAAGSKKVKIILRGVNVDIYKVLKLAKLSSRLAFVN